MQLKIKSITFSNFLSYGASPTTITFTNGLVLCSGANGQGKSSALLDTLSYCLYGKPYRKIKIEEILNRKNKGNLKTTCEFSIGSDEYKLTRNKEPDKLQLIKNGNELDLLSSKKLTQLEIDKILGVNYEIFKQTISIAVSYNKPFLCLDSANKRKTVEQMFSLGEFGKMSKILQEKAKTSKKAYDILENNISNVESTIRILNKQIVDLEEQNKNFDRLNKEKIDRHLQEISREQTFLSDKLKELEPIQKIVDSLQEKIQSINKSKYTTAKSKFDKQETELECNIRSLSNQIKKLTTETACPTCKKPFDESKRLQEIQDKEALKKESETALIDIAKKVKDLSDNIDTIEKMERKLSGQQSILQGYQIEIRDRQRNIQGHQDQIEEIKNTKNVIDIDSVIKELSEKHLELERNKVSKNIEFKSIRNYKIADSILGDDGVKSFIIEKVVPIVNKKISEYLELFDINIRLSFNKNMDEKIISLEHFNKEINYWSLSEGEKKRVDVAIMFSLLETMKIVSNWESNVLLVDELLDNSVDASGLEQMIMAMKEMSVKKELNINIISHRMNENFSHLFDRKMVVKKNIHGFSEIQNEKN